MASSRRACGFVIFRRFSGEIKYLMMQTSYGSQHWTPPKGHVDPGETDMTTALRETEEEAGFTREDLNIFENAKLETIYNVNNKPKTVVYWLAELINENKDARLSHEHREFKWLNVQEACRVAEYKEMQSIIQYFHKWITDNNL